MMSKGRLKPGQQTTGGPEHSRRPARLLILVKRIHPELIPPSETTFRTPDPWHGLPPALRPSQANDRGPSTGLGAQGPARSDGLEKVLKAELIRLGWRLEKTHDLDRLLDELVTPEFSHEGCA
jgi:hypothetical protein